MKDKQFLDTNILLYAYDRDAGEKRQVALSFIANALSTPAKTVISVQVLQEFHVNFLRQGGARDELDKLVTDFSRWKVVENTLSLYRLGSALQQRWQLSLWDSMILAAAQTARCSCLYSEDFNDGQDYNGVRAVNPFRKG